jgi:hypothetical protein
VLFEFLTDALVALLSSLLVLVYYPGLSALTHAGCAFDEPLVIPIAIF